MFAKLLALTLFSGTIYASQEELITHFFSYLAYIGNSQNKVDASSLKEFVTEDFVIQSNNELISRGFPECLSYIEEMQNKYKLVSYSDFLEPPIIAENKAVVHFQVNCLSHTGPDEFLDAIAILTFENGKISYWNEVYHEIDTIPTKL